MPRPGLRSRSSLRKKIRTPGNVEVIHYSRKKPNRAQCSMCKKPLQSVPRLVKPKMRRTRLTSRRANRMESGRYCSKCLQSLIRESIWQK